MAQERSVTTPHKASARTQRKSDTRPSVLRRWLAYGASALLGPAALAVAFAAAWAALSVVDFGYPILYDWLDIDAHIERYGPENRYRSGFETTSDAARKALFAGMVAAINNGGAGLRALRYRPPGASRPITLLRPPEIAHLRLVAGLVSAVRMAGLTGLLGLFAIVAVLRWQRRTPVRWANAAGTAASLSALALLAYAAFDAGDGGWFAELHERIFPAGHQWFFYYQESLMTTLLKAPDIFGPIALELGLLSGALFAGLMYAIGHYLRRRV